MRVRWERASASERARERPVVLTLAGILVAMALSMALGPFLVLPPCLFHWLTGFPCPTCGTTRCVGTLLRGDVAAALRIQPMVCLLLVALALCLCYETAAMVWRWPRLRIADASRREKWAAAWVGLLAVLANWAYLVAAGV